jgi:hypothetical protein
MRVQTRMALLKLDAGFLLLAGTVQLILETSSHFFQLGPFRQVFNNSPYTIGFFEAHGLAVLIGFLLFTRAFNVPDLFWHKFAMAVHMLLGGANLLFWNSFTYFGLIPAGAITTLLHGFFAIAQIVCFASVRKVEKPM